MSSLCQLLAFRTTFWVLRRSAFRNTKSHYIPCATHLVLISFQFPHLFPLLDGCPTACFFISQLASLPVSPSPTSFKPRSLVQSSMLHSPSPLSPSNRLQIISHPSRRQTPLSLKLSLPGVLLKLRASPQQSASIHFCWSRFPFWKSWHAQKPLRKSSPLHESWNSSQSTLPSHSSSLQFICRLLLMALIPKGVKSYTLFGGCMWWDLTLVFNTCRTRLGFTSLTPRQVLSRIYVHYRRKRYVHYPKRMILPLMDPYRLQKPVRLLTKRLSFHLHDHLFICLRYVLMRIHIFVHQLSIVVSSSYSVSRLHSC